MRSGSILLWNAYFTKTASHIPYAVVKNKTSATLFNLIPDDEEDDDLVEGGVKKKKLKKVRTKLGDNTQTDAAQPCSCGRKATKKKAVNMTGMRPKQTIGM